MELAETKAVKIFRVRMYFFIHMDGTGWCGYNRTRRDGYAVGKREWAYCDTSQYHLTNSVSEKEAIDRRIQTGVHSVDPLGLTHETVKLVQLIHSGFGPAFLCYYSFDLLTEWFKILRRQNKAV